MLRNFYSEKYRVMSKAFTYMRLPIKAPFCLSSIGEYICDDRYYTERDGLEEYLLIYTVDGCGELFYNEQKIKLTPKSLVLINCKKYQLYSTVKNSSWHFRWIHFSAMDSICFEEYINDDKIYICNSETVFNDIFNELKNIDEMTGAYEQIRISQMLQTIIGDMIYYKNIAVSKSNDTLETAINYINNNYKNEISIEKLADLCGISKYHFIRQFKKMYGTTPHKYIIIKRVDSAKRLLLNSNMSVGEIAEKAGFCDSKNFILHFKAVTNVTPHKYKESIQN
ncbi:MAG: AraC family transcriptional regulator [Ruminococcaceae bacterium]|nr:AraC family transcriptional regulator [Oscillospiraceae bacterium]